MLNKNGFTLIELLVVVLIIGILAAIALPQYQKSVEKSKAMEAVITVRTLAESYKRYQLESGGLPATFDDLDVSAPLTDIQEWTGNNPPGQKGTLSKNWTVLIYQLGVIAYRADSKVNIFWQVGTGDIICATSNGTPDSLCRALGAVDYNPPKTSCGWTWMNCLYISTPGKI
jgi:prepilin-type N-terminal cleavage/methylation domain-containing protein